MSNSSIYPISVLYTVYIALEEWATHIYNKVNCVMFAVLKHSCSEDHNKTMKPPCRILFGMQTRHSCTYIVGKELLFHEPL